MEAVGGSARRGERRGTVGEGRAMGRSGASLKKHAEQEHGVGGG